METPLVSVCMITYNHAPYIAQAIEGAMMQQCDFPFELIIGEDSSTDNTRAIVLEYKEKYLDKIRLLLREKNVGMERNFIETMQAAKGKYIALCEGDDYWTDPCKLQKQVDFLEANQEYVISSCKFKMLNMFNNQFESYDYSSIFSKGQAGVSFSLEQIFSDWYLQTLCVVFRKDELCLGNIELYKYFRDNHLFLEIMRNGGKGYIFNDYCGVYRIHQGGVYSGIETEKRIKDSICVFKDIYRVNPLNFIAQKLYCRYDEYFEFLNEHKGLKYKLKLLWVYLTHEVYMFQCKKYRQTYVYRFLKCVWLKIKK